jgi:hypothetical protein
VPEVEEEQPDVPPAQVMVLVQHLSSVVTYEIRETGSESVYDFDEE